MTFTEKNRATWFCVDIETNGPVPSLYDMVSLGVVVVVVEPEGRLVPGPSLYLELKPEVERIDPEAVRIHGLERKYLQKNGLPRREACARLTQWVRDHTAPGSNPVFVGHNAPFDWSFVAWVFAAEGMPNPFGYKAFCTKSLAAGVLGLHWLDTNKERLAVLLSLDPEDTSRKHRADYDAAYQARILIALLDKIEEKEAGRSEGS